MKLKMWNCKQLVYVIYKKKSNSNLLFYLIYYYVSSIVSGNLHLVETVTRDLLANLINRYVAYLVLCEQYGRFLRQPIFAILAKYYQDYSYYYYYCTRCVNKRSIL